ncbi:MAG: dienelactone hydrolase family protein [Moraxella sp.]|nr:dienelactone hydrolase family protein [Moraxella sp.]
MTNTPLTSVVVEHNPNRKPIDKAVIWLHGLGANGNDFVPVVPELGLSADLAVRFIFPNAPSIAVTINGGYVMPAWYDIYEMSLNRKIDETQIRTSAKSIHDIVKQLNNEGIDSKNIVIAGFSQGGAVAYEVALASDVPFAGLMALSTYFATKDSIDIQASRALPILICHGSYDDVVPKVLGEQACETLRALGFSPVYQDYPMAHQVCLAQIKGMGEWLNNVLS